MTRAWFLQANPKLYDIDGALASLEEISWRIPQYTSEVHVGDVAVLWRSGPEAGAIGVGRVIGEPKLIAAPDLDDAAFMLDSSDPGETTRALIRILPTPFVSKSNVAALESLKDHPIVVAPMGTVFPLDEAAWLELSPLLHAPPPVAGARERPELPRAFHWRERAKGVLPMPGGYDGYLKSLRAVCELIDVERPAKSELPVRMEELLGVTSIAARHRESFLRKMGVVQVEGGICRLSDWACRWIETGDDRIIAALLHSRCQLIGELLDVCREPRSVDELRAEANERFAMGWDTATQINNRRGWLQSAGMLTALDDRRVHLTDAGLSLLEHLDLFMPEGIIELASNTAGRPVAESTTPPEPEPDPDPAEARADTGHRLAAICAELLAASTDSSDPDRFERAARDAFAWLGFRAEWLGGSGKTDVLLDALLGRDDSYRVIVDCKTSGTGSVGDHQIDWVTLAEHRQLHDADHVAVVAPNPSGRRLFERARDQGVAILSAEQLVGLCRQHARAPLALDDYREMFRRGGSVDTTVTDERADESKGAVALAVAVCEAVRDRSETFGRLSARDLFLILADDPVADGITEERIQTILDALASPLLALLNGERGTGYRMASSAATSRLRLELLGERLATPD